jgi:predicted DNA-binding transcriptional regulator AlpA
MRAASAAQEDAPMADTHDELLRAPDIEKMFKVSRRTIRKWIKQGRFPPPDLPGGNGAAHGWRRSTALRHLDTIAPSDAPST